MRIFFYIYFNNESIIRQPYDLWHYFESIINLNINIMRIAGIILLVLGLIGTIIFGIQAINESEAFNVLGIEVAVSSANWTPVIISAAVLLVGLIMMATGKKR